MTLPMVILLVLAAVAAYFGVMWYYNTKGRDDDNSAAIEEAVQAAERERSGEFSAVDVFRTGPGVPSEPVKLSKRQQRKLAVAAAAAAAEEKEEEEVAGTQVTDSVPSSAVEGAGKQTRKSRRAEKAAARAAGEQLEEDAGSVEPEQFEGVDSGAATGVDDTAPAVAVEAPDAAEETQTLTAEPELDQRETRQSRRAAKAAAKAAQRAADSEAEGEPADSDLPDAGESEELAASEDEVVEPVEKKRRWGRGRTEDVEADSVEAPVPDAYARAVQAVDSAAAPQEPKKRWWQRSKAADQLPDGTAGSDNSPSAGVVASDASADDDGDSSVPAWFKRAQRHKAEVDETAPPLPAVNDISATPLAEEEVEEAGLVGPGGVLQRDDVDEPDYDDYAPHLVGKSIIEASFIEEEAARLEAERKGQRRRLFGRKPAVVEEELNTVATGTLTVTLGQGSEQIDHTDYDLPEPIPARLRR